MDIIGRLLIHYISLYTILIICLCTTFPRIPTDLTWLILRSQQILCQLKMKREEYFWQEEVSQVKLRSHAMSLSMKDLNKEEIWSSKDVLILWHQYWLVEADHRFMLLEAHFQVNQWTNAKSTMLLQTLGLRLQAWILVETSTLQ